ncbi:Hypothetical predicted protein [Octopus vulgaris]|uniref:Uncharacterized protein n=1 Tax=Octopus vulgaris TaxID=6645 RepID=A0AA36ASM6_OCTVU|nr:Hypothetical predicted protein [Octopus vulgaris]
MQSAEVIWNSIIIYLRREYNSVQMTTLEKGSFLEFMILNAVCYHYIDEDGDSGDGADDSGDGVDDSDDGTDDSGDGADDEEKRWRDDHRHLQLLLIVYSNTTY